MCVQRFIWIRPSFGRAVYYCCIDGFNAKQFSYVKNKNDPNAKIIWYKKRVLLSFLCVRVCILVAYFAACSPRLRLPPHLLIFDSSISKCMCFCCLICGRSVCVFNHSTCFHIRTQTHGSRKARIMRRIRWCTNTISDVRSFSSWILSTISTLEYTYSPVRRVVHIHTTIQM